MGYYSNYDITTEPPLEGLAELLKEQSGGYYFENRADGWANSGDDIKWYDWQHDVAVLSRAHPDTKFDVEQVGEDGDGERRVYQAGVTVRRYVRGWEEVSL